MWQSQCLKPRHAISVKQITQSYFSVMFSIILAIVTAVSLIGLFICCCYSQTLEVKEKGSWIAWVHLLAVMSLFTACASLVRWINYGVVFMKPHIHLDPCLESSKRQQCGYSYSELGPIYIELHIKNKSFILSCQLTCGGILHIAKPLRDVLMYDCC